MTKLFIIFVVCNIINVIIQTVKSIATIKCGKGMASIINALAYGFYTYIVVLMVCELPLLTKCFVVGACNLVGVFVVKWCEEKARRDKLWLVKITIPIEHGKNTKMDLANFNIPFTCYNVGKYYVFDTYCETQQNTIIVSKICKQYKGKAFATENRLKL